MATDHSMFKVVNESEEKDILTASTRQGRGKGPDFSIRTVTHWFTLPTRFGVCTVPGHNDIIPDFDNNYMRERNRQVITIGAYEVCRWCYVKEQDRVAANSNLPPEESTPQMSEAELIAHVREHRKQVNEMKREAGMKK